MSLIDVDTAPTVAVTTEALTWPAQANALRVVDATSYQGAAEMLLGIKDLRKRISETFDPHIDRAHKAHKALVAEKKTAETPLIEAETIIKSALKSYDAAQEALRVAEQRRLQELARKEAEDRALAEAMALEAEAAACGDADLRAMADDILAAPVVPVAVSVPRSTPVVAGIAYSETWRADVTDLHALVRFVAANPSYLNLLVANTTALNGMARSLKSSMRIPGVAAKSERGVRAGVR